MKVLLLLLLTTSLASAQIILQKAVIANAGGSTANSATILNYTVGETAVGSASNGITNGQFGFWNASSVAASVDANTVAGLTVVGVRPNPASESVTIALELQKASPLGLRIYDAMGRRIAEIYSGKKEAGTHQFTYDARLLSSGTYFIAASVPGGLLQTRLTIVR